MVNVRILYSSTLTLYNPLTTGPNFILFFNWHFKYQFLKMLKIKRDINQQDFKIVDLHFVKFEYFSLTWCEDTISTGWKLKLNNLAVKGLKR